MLRIFSVLIIIILLILAVFCGNVYAMIILGVMVFAWCLSMLANVYLKGKIRYTVKTDGIVRNGRAGISVTIYNDGALPALFFRGKLVVENTFTGERRTERFGLPVRGKNKNVFAPEVCVSSCGKYTVRVEKASLTDMFGIAGLPVKAEDHCSFTVLPDIFDVVVDLEVRESDSFDNELYSPYKRGRDRTEVFQIREYESGDSLSSIHWKLSGKQDKLMVKDPSLPLNKELIIAVDKSTGAEPSVSQCERLAETALSVCSSLNEAGMTYKLIWNDAANNMLFMNEIQFESDFMESLNEILSGKPAVSDESLATLFEKMSGSIDTTHVIYISIDQREIPEGVFRGGSIKEVPTDCSDYRERYGMISF